MPSLDSSPLVPVALIPDTDACARYHDLQDLAGTTKFVNLLEATLANQAASAPQSPAMAPTARYVVQEGDNLYTICQKLGISDHHTLARANGLDNPDLLKIGQVLKLPSQPQAGPSPTSYQPPVRLANQPKDTNASSQVCQYVVQPGDTLAKISRDVGIQNPLALASLNQLSDPDHLAIGQVLKLPGATETNPEQACHRAPSSLTNPPLPLPKPRPQPGGQIVVASWYGSQHHGQLMANGQPFNMFADTVAHRSLPLGTEVRLTNPRNNREITATVTDRGPYIKGRDLDVSYGIARRLGIVRAGVAPLKMQKISNLNLPVG
ncbi:MAG: septal ring lytic transglycosylase RlpA family protein [Desulfobacca sp.]|nr:septal ring lytic transglycosylase RlpA family protein [Desulfobacca sp.]